MNTEFYLTQEEISRFWDKVSKDPGQGRDGNCWEWQRYKNRKGYGQVGIGYRVAMSHRLSYALANGNFPSELLVIHSCDNPSCVNPAHLSLGTAKDNTQDMLAKRRHSEQKKTHCRAGHAFTAANTYIVNRGKSRACKTCAKARSQAKRDGRIETTESLARLTSPS